MRSASGRSPPSSARPISIAWCWRPIRRGRPIPNYAATAARARHRTARRCRCPSIATITRTTAPLVVTHQEQFPAVTLSFDLAPGYSLGDAVQAVAAAETGHRHAGNDHRQLFGRCRRVPEIAGRGALADPGRAGGDLHRAWRAVRKLDPSGHHPVHAAVGRHRRAAGADAVRASTCRWWRWSASCC